MALFNFFTISGSIGEYPYSEIAVSYDESASGLPWLANYSTTGITLGEVLAKFDETYFNLGTISLSNLKIPYPAFSSEICKFWFDTWIGAQIAHNIYYIEPDIGVNTPISMEDTDSKQLANFFRNYSTNTKGSMEDVGFNINGSYSTKGLPFYWVRNNVQGGDSNYYNGNYHDAPGAYIQLSIPVFATKSIDKDGNILPGARFRQYSLTVSYYGHRIGQQFTLSFYAETNVLDVPSFLVNNKITPFDPSAPTNPYEPIGPSGPSDDTGGFDDESDPIPPPPLPTFSSANTGFTRIYNPTLAQVQNLADYLWTDDTFFQTVWNRVKQVFENPISAIIGFNLVPVPVPDGGSKNFALMFIDTGVAMNVAASQFVDVDCGTLTLEKYYGSALDYMPYTKVTCFLPYIGNVTLDTDEVMGRELQVKYRVDIVSGACVAYIIVDGNVMYQFSGHCAINIPINSADFSTYISTIISAAKLALTAAGGAIGVATASSVPVATQHTAASTTVTTTERNPATGRQIITGTQTTSTDRETTTTKAAYEGLQPENIANTVGQIMGSKPHIDHTGSFSGNSGFLGVRRPYLIIERPNLCMPANYQALNGFPAMYTVSLSSCKGFTRVQQVQLTGVWATNPEQAEILELLKMGVIF